MKPLPDHAADGKQADDRRLLRNTGALTISRGVTLVAGLVITAWLGRVLGPANYGIIGFATAIVSYFTLGVALGLDTLGARDVARHAARVRAIASHIVTLRLSLSAVALAGLAAFVALVDKPPLVKLVVAIHGVWLVAIALNLDFVYQGRARMGLIAVREAMVSLVTLAGVVIVVRNASDVVPAASVIMAAMLVGAVLVAIRCRRDFGAPVLRFDLHIWKLLLRSSLPIAGVGILVTLFRNLDTVMLGFMRSSTDVGFYTAAFKFFTTALAPVMVVLAAFTPVLAAAWNRPEQMRAAMAKFVAVLAALMAPVSVAGVVFAPEFVTFLFGKGYLPAVGAVRILTAAAWFATLDIAFGHPLLLWNRQKQALMPLAFGALVNAALNGILIPRYGIEGAAVATLGAEAVIVAWFAVLQVRLGGSLAVRVIALHLSAAALAGVLSKYIVATGFGITASETPLRALLLGPPLFMVLYGALIMPLWWRRLVGR